jgi:hypothetical protein
MTKYLPSANLVCHGLQEFTRINTLYLIRVNQCNPWLRLPQA